VICRHCGLVWTDPRPTPEQVVEFYAHEYRRDYKGTYQPKPKHIYRAGKVAVDRFQRLQPFLKPGARVLDVGAGSGEVVYVLRAMGYEASGFEPNEGYARFAAGTLGVPVRQGFWQDVAIPPESQDIVTMFHVVEQPHTQFHRGHLYHFNLATLEMMARRAGFAITHGSASADGGNLTVISQKTHSTATVGAGEIPGNYERVRSILRRHTTFRHLFSRHPYIRPFRKLAARMEEKRSVKSHRPAREMLDALISDTFQPD